MANTSALRDRLSGAATLAGFGVHGVSSAAEARTTLVEEGAFACVVAEQGLADGLGAALLSDIEGRWPWIGRVLITAPDELDEGVRALEEGVAGRLLREPCVPDAWGEAIARAASRSDRERQAEQRAEELAFTRGSLEHFLGEIEERLADEVRSLRDIRELGTALAQADSMFAVARLAARGLSRALDGRTVQIELASPSPDRPRIEAHSGAGPEPERLIDVPITSGFATRLRVEDGDRLSERDRRILGSFLSSTTLAVQAQLHRMETENAKHTAVFALARLAERRDNETGEHLNRVSEFTRVIAEGLRAAGVYTAELSDGFIHEVVRSAPLHDIGKVGIPDHVLLKPGKLNESEWEIMRSHTVIGGDTLRSVIESATRPGFLLVAHDIALYHHERWNGNGYPEGLAGERIPLSARIVALADVYDALTSRRPYKEPWSHADAMELILSERGEHFDPSVVDAFVANEERILAIRRAHPDPEEGARTEGKVA